MALMDMNGDGKNDIADDFLEYMIVSGEIDEEEQEEEDIDYVPMYSAKSSYTAKNNSSVKPKANNSTDDFADRHPILAGILGFAALYILVLLAAVAIKYVLPLLIVIVGLSGLAAGKK